MTTRAFTERGRRRALALGIPPERLPPGQSPTEKWPVLSIEETPRLTSAEISLQVDGAVARPFTLDFAQLMAEPQAEWRGDLHCVTRWSKFDMHWRGVEVRSLIERAGPSPDACFVLAHSVTGYTTNLPLADLLEHPTLVAHEADGAALEPEHGGPLRLLVPHLYLWKSAKWLSRLEIREHDELGFWETHGYHHRGDPWAEERHSVDDYVARAMRREARSGARARTRTRPLSDDPRASRR